MEQPVQGLAAFNVGGPAVADEVGVTPIEAAGGALATDEHDTGDTAD